MDYLQLDLRILILFLLIIIFGSFLRQREGFADKDIDCSVIQGEITSANTLIDTLQSGVNDFKKRSQDIGSSVKTLRDFVGTYKCSYPEPVLDPLPDIPVDYTMTPPRNGVDNFLPPGVIIVSSELRSDNQPGNTQNPNFPPRSVGDTLDLQRLVRSVPSIRVDSITFKDATSSIFTDRNTRLTIVLRGPRNNQYTRTFSLNQIVRFRDLTDPPPPPPPAPAAAPAPAPVPIVSSTTTPSPPAPAPAAAAAAAAPAPNYNITPSRSGRGNFLPSGVSIQAAELRGFGMSTNIAASFPSRSVGDTRDLINLSRSVPSFRVDAIAFPQAIPTIFSDPNLTLTIKLRNAQNVDYSRVFRRNEIVEFSKLTPPAARQPPLDLVSANWGPPGVASRNVVPTIIDLYNTGVNSVAVSKANFGTVGTGFFSTLPHRLNIIFRRTQISPLGPPITTTNALVQNEGQTLNFSQIQ